MLKNNYTFTNQDFCYWLQGYFEINSHADFDQSTLHQIAEKLLEITQPWGELTRWLNESIHFLRIGQYNREAIIAFSSVLQDRLNEVFEHVIDNSYDTPHSKTFLKAVHEGINR
ncbi:MAG: hypothetical protein ACYCQI_12880 [Gammaproteobacteria bacterium]